MKIFKRHLALILILALAGLILSGCSAGNQPAGDGGSENDEIAESVRAYLSAQGAQSNEVEVKVDQILGGFARVQISSSNPVTPGAYTGFLQEIDGDWTTLLVGSGFNPDEVQRLGIPQAILPEDRVLPAPQVTTGDEPTCPAAADGSLAYVDQGHGYCFLYPAGYSVEQPNLNETVLVIGSLMNHTDPRVRFTSEPANGRSATQAADESLAVFGLPADAIQRTETILGGAEAIMLDNMPGQDINRQIFVVHEGVLYHLLFTPFDPSLGETHDLAEELFATVTGSLVFQTPVAAGPPDPFTSLIDDFAGTGATVQETAVDVIQPFFTPAGRLVRLNGADLQIFEYESAEAAQFEASLVAPDGSSVGTHDVTWLASSHFFMADQFIVLYLGDDPAVLEILEAILGLQFAGASGDATVNLLPINCQPGDSGSIQFVNPELSYCLVYPSDFEMLADDPANVVISGPAYGDGPEPIRAVLTILWEGPAPAGGLTQALDELTHEVQDLPIATNNSTLGGQPAVFIEGMPGRNENQQYLAIHDGNLYRLILQPFGLFDTEVNADLALLETMLHDSFAFLPLAGG